MITRAPIGQDVKMFRQLKTTPGHVKERVCPKQKNQEDGVQRYGRLKAIKKDETIFNAYNKAEMRKAKQIQTSYTLPSLCFGRML